MIDLNEMLVFAKVAELGGFSAAARALRVPKSTVSRSVSRLEDRLAIRLVNRTTRQVALTDVGRAYYVHCLRVLEEIERAEAAADDLRASPRGLLRVSASFTLGRDLLAPLLGDLARLHPDIRVELRLTTREVDQIEEGVDVAVRVGALPDSSLVARRLASLSMHLFAAPGYLARRGEPAHPSELPGFDLIDYGPRDEAGCWRLLGEFGEDLAVRFEPRATINDSATMREAAKAGVGIVAATDVLCAEDEAAGRLVRVLPSWRLPELEVHAVLPGSRGHAPKVRAFMDLLVEACRRGAPREAPVLAEAAL